MGVEVVWASYLGDSTRIAEAQHDDSGETCGKHRTWKKTKVPVVRHVWPHKVYKGVEAVLASIWFKLVTRSIGFYASDG